MVRDIYMNFLKWFIKFPTDPIFHLVIYLKRTNQTPAFLAHQDDCG